jgi:hypothetical protein
MNRIHRFLAIILLFLSLPIVVEAHKGRTDSSGGHTDHSTGKYHYHHGYSAHSHYDMDSDGDADCPYSFKDKTDHNGNQSATLKETESITKEKQRSYQQTMSDLLGKVFTYGVVAGLVLMFLSHPIAFFDENLGGILMQLGFWIFALQIPILFISVLLL